MTRLHDPSSPPGESKAEPGRLLDPTGLGDHLDRLYRAAWALTGSREDAEDLVQETYVRVLARPRTVRGEDLGYLLVALRNTFFSRKRAEGRRPRTAALTDELELPQERSSNDPHAVFEAGEVLAAVTGLPEDFRDVVVSVDLVGLSYEEAAKALRIPIGTVMSRLYRGRQRVVRALGHTAAA